MPSSAHAVAREPLQPSRVVAGRAHLEFDLTRRKKDLLTFGRGPHMCPGAPLARLLLNVAIEGIVRRTAQSMSTVSGY